MSPYDEYALESALQLKESGGGDLVAITCGPTRAAKMLTDAAAVGADSLLHILVEDISALDSTQVQSILAAAVAHSGSDIVFCGKQAADTNAGSTGPGVAHLMDASCVTMVSEVASDGSSSYGHARQFGWQRESRCFSSVRLRLRQGHHRTTPT